MFNKKDFDFSFYILKNYRNYDVVSLDSDIFDFGTIIESFIKQEKLKEAFNYLKEELSLCTIECDSKSDFAFLKRLILRKLNELEIEFSKIKNRNLNYTIEYNILIRFIEDLAIYLIDSNPEIKEIPNNWKHVYQNEYTGSRSRKLKQSLNTNHCLIKVEKVNSEINFKNNLYNLHAFINLFVFCNFTKKIRTTEFRRNLETLSQYDFSLTSTKDFIKKNSLIPSKYKSEIKNFYQTYLTKIENEELIPIDQFNPNNQISSLMIGFFSSMIERFKKFGKYETSDLVQICFNPVNKDTNYYHQELSFLAQKLKEGINLL